MTLFPGSDDDFGGNTSDSDDGSDDSNHCSDDIEKMNYSVTEVSNQHTATAVSNEMHQHSCHISYIQTIHAHVVSLTHTHIQHLQTFLLFFHNSMILRVVKTKQDGMVVEVEEEAFMYRAVVLVEVVVVTVHGAV